MLLTSSPYFMRLSKTFLGYSALTLDNYLTLFSSASMMEAHIFLWYFWVGLLIDLFLFVSCSCCFLERYWCSCSSIYLKSIYCFRSHSYAFFCCNYYIYWGITCFLSKICFYFLRWTTSLLLYLSIYYLSYLFFLHSSILRDIYLCFYSLNFFVWASLCSLKNCSYLFISCMMCSVYALLFC